jgi:hypothetical protein
MIALYDFVPKFCPNCGADTGVSKVGHVDNYHDYKAHASQACRKCGLHSQYADTGALLTAATDSGGDLANYADRPLPPYAREETDMDTK